MDYRDWIEQEIKRAEGRLRSEKMHSSEWLMALHHLEVLDECFMQYTGGERIVDQRLLKHSQAQSKKVTNWGDGRASWTDRYWKEIILTLVLVLIAFWSLTFGERPVIEKPGFSDVATWFFSKPPIEHACVIETSNNPYLNQGLTTERERYANEVIRIIKKNWIPPRKSQATDAVFYFEIDSAGQLDSVIVLAYSSSPTVTKSAREAIFKSVPFPIPPAEKITLQVAFWDNLVCGYSDD